MTQEEMFKELPVLVYDKKGFYRVCNIPDDYLYITHPTIHYDKSSKQFIVSYFKEPEDDFRDGYINEYFMGDTIEEAIKNAYNAFLSDGLFKKKDESICSKCAFSVDNCYCGLPGFTSKYPRYESEGCSAFNKESPNGYSLQANGLFGWSKSCNGKKL